MTRMVGVLGAAETWRCNYFDRIDAIVLLSSIAIS